MDVNVIGVTSVPIVRSIVAALGETRTICPLTFIDTTVETIFPFEELLPNTV